MKKIAFTIYSLEAGGAERVVSNLSLALSRHYEVYIFVFDGRNRAYNFGGKLVNLDVPVTNRKIDKFLNVIKRKKRLAFYEKLYDIDVNISFMSSSNLINVLTNTKRKRVVSLRSNNAIHQQGIQHYIDKFIYKKADFIVPVSKVMMDNVLKVYPFIKKKLILIPNFVDRNLLTELSEKNVSYNFESDLKYIVILGRLEPVKGHKYLLRSLAYVKENFDNFKLLIIGEGRERSKLEKLVHDLKLQENVEFLGHVKNPYPYLKKSSLYVLTSLYEGMPNSLLEAMSLGLPVIATDCETGPKEILQSDCQGKLESYGILVSPFKESTDYPNLEIEERIIELSDAITFMLNNGEVRKEYRNKSLKRIEKYDSNTIINQWIKLIEI